MSCLPTSRGLFRTRARRNNISFSKTTRWKTSEIFFPNFHLFPGSHNESKTKQKIKVRCPKNNMFYLTNRERDKIMDPLVCI